MPIAPATPIAQSKRGAERNAPPTNISTGGAISDCSKYGSRREPRVIAAPI